MLTTASRLLEFHRDAGHPGPADGCQECAKVDAACAEAERRHHAHLRKLARRVRTLR
jgi:hypothetical protein